jgi:hypothetical protein
MKIRPAFLELFHVDKRMDGRTDGDILIGALQGCRRTKIDRAVLLTCDHRTHEVFAGPVLSTRASGECQNIALPSLESLGARRSVVG